MSSSTKRQVRPSRMVSSPLGPTSARCWAGGSSATGRADSLGLKALEDARVDGVFHGRRAAQDPKVVPTGMSHHGVLVVLAQVDDPVVAPEGPEEGHLELGVGGGVDHARATLGRIFFSLQGSLATAVDDADLSVIAQGVGRGGAGASLLESLGIARDLKPGAGVSRQIDLGDRLEGGRPRRSVVVVAQALVINPHKITNRPLRRGRGGGFGGRLRVSVGIMVSSERYPDHPR